MKNHSENKWKDIIPILIEIGILYLQKEFSKIIFTYEELKKFSLNLQHEQIEKDKEKSKEMNKEGTIYDSLNIENDKEDKKIILKNKINVGDNNINNNGNNQKINLVDANKNNQEKLKISNDAIKEMKNTIKNNYHNFKNNISTDFKNKLNKQKQEHFKKINIEKNLAKGQKEKDKEKISYAISYDKNLRPASISRKINNTTNNNTNIKTDYTTNPNNLFYNSSYNFSSEKKFKNPQSKSKSKNKEKYLNLNLNNLNKFDKIKNKEIRHYNVSRQIVKNNIVRIGGNEKPNYYKKLNNIIKKCNLLNNEPNLNNNYHAIKVKKQLDKIHLNKNFNNSNNYGQNYFKNSNLINTLFQRMNSNDKNLKSMNNYFSNREELENFISKNRFDKNKIINKSEPYKHKCKKGFIKSEKPVDRKNSFLRLEEDEMENNIKKELEKNRNKSTRSMKNKEKEKLKESRGNMLLKSLPSRKEMLNIEKNEDNTPKKIYIKTEKDKTSTTKNNNENFNEVNEKKEIDNDDKKEGLKIINLFEIKLKEKKEKIENKEKNPFLKNLSKDRYVNMFGHEGEADFSLTQIEKDYSGIYDSSISNENQISPEYFFKEGPKNIFKNDKSNEQSLNSNDNKA